MNTSAIIVFSFLATMLLLVIYWERKARREADEYRKKVRKMDPWTLDEHERRIS